MKIVDIFLKIIKRITKFAARKKLAIKKREIMKKAKITQDIKIFAETEFENMTDNRESISVGSKCCIRGNLRAYPCGGKIIVGDNCYIGERTKIWSMESITIGNDVLIAHNVNILDTNSHSLEEDTRKNELQYILRYGEPKENIFKRKTAPVVIEDGVWIGLNSIILKGVTIGQGAVIAAGSVVTRDIPPHCVAAGNPAKIVKTLKEEEECEIEF